MIKLRRTQTCLKKQIDAFVNRHWTICFSAFLIALSFTIILLFLKGGTIGAIAVTIMLIKIWEV